MDNMVKKRKEFSIKASLKQKGRKRNIDMTKDS